MGKVLITGNGFDLFHHLPTKYHHFISILETIENSNYINDITFDELFGDAFKTKFLNEFSSMVENYKVENIKFDFNKIDELKGLLSENLWYKHFKRVLEINTWIDFEIEIENILNQFVIFNKHDDKRLIRKNLFDDHLFGFTDFELFQIIENKPIGRIPFSLNKKYINLRNNSIDVKKMLEDLTKSFEQFIVIFNCYLIDIMSVFYAEIKEKLTIPFHLINDIYTFNYTPTLEKIYNVDSSKIVYLHGQINENSGMQNIVLGISEMPKDIQVNKMFDFTKYYQKVNKNSNKNFIKVPDAIKSTYSETIFYVIGHSLDESDKEYIVDLFKFLEFDYDRYSKICVFYYDTIDKENKLKNLFSIIDKDTILEMNKHGRLYFVELNVENINKEFSNNLKTHNFVM